MVGAELQASSAPWRICPMRDWLFSDMGFLFFTAWSVMLAAIGYAAFIRDLEPSRAMLRGDAVSRLTSRNAGGR